MDEQQACRVRVRALAYETIVKVQSVLRGQLDCYDPELHAWAAQQSAHLPIPSQTERAIVDAIEACLVDILSCDDAPWDTTREAFMEDMHHLRELLDG